MTEYAFLNTCSKKRFWILSLLGFLNTPFIRASSESQEIVVTETSLRVTSHPNNLDKHCLSACHDKIRFYYLSLCETQPNKLNLFCLLFIYLISCMLPAFLEETPDHLTSDSAWLIKKNQINRCSIGQVKPHISALPLTDNNRSFNVIGQNYLANEIAQVTIQSLCL